MDWIIANWPYILSVCFGVIVLASIIVKLTKTDKDNEVVNKIIDVLDKFSIAKTDRDKAMLAAAKENLKSEEEKTSTDNK